MNQNSKKPMSTVHVDAEAYRYLRRAQYLRMKEEARRDAIWKKVKDALVFIFVAAGVLAMFLGMMFAASDNSTPQQPVEQGVNSHE